MVQACAPTHTWVARHSPLSGPRYFRQEILDGCPCCSSDVLARIGSGATSKVEDVEEQVAPEEPGVEKAVVTRDGRILGEDGRSRDSSILPSSSNLPIRGGGGGRQQWRLLSRDRLLTFDLNFPARICALHVLVPRAS